MHLLNMLAPEGVATTNRLSDLSFGAAQSLPRSAWAPPRDTLMVSEGVPSTPPATHGLSARDLSDLEQAWAPTVRMGL